SRVPRASFPRTLEDARSDRDALDRAVPPRSTPCPAARRAATDLVADRVAPRGPRVRSRFPIAVALRRTRQAPSLPPLRHAARAHADARPSAAIAAGVARGDPRVGARNRPRDLRLLEPCRNAPGEVPRISGGRPGSDHLP